MLADDLRAIAEWLEDEQRDLIERAPSVASGMYEKAQILWAIAARLEGRVVVKAERLAELLWMSAPISRKVPWAEVHPDKKRELAEQAAAICTPKEAESHG